MTYQVRAEYVDGWIDSAADGLAGRSRYRAGGDDVGCGVYVIPAQCYVTGLLSLRGKGLSSTYDGVEKARS